MSIPERTKKTIYVAGFDSLIKQSDLLEIFLVFGDIIEIHLPLLSDGNHRGFGFIVYQDTQSVQDAIDNMNLNQIGSRIVQVALAKPLKSSQLSSNLPVWQDEEWIKQYALQDSTQQDEQSTE